MSIKKATKVNEHLEKYQDLTEKIPLIEERYEMINGIRYDFTPSPTFDHQVLVTKLSNELYKTCYPNGYIVVAPMDVHLDTNNIIQPDVIYISNERTHIIQGQKIIGAPDLLIEILSPSTSKKDKTIKKDLFEKFGVTEYWIVDPVHYIIDQFVLEDQAYKGYQSYGLGDILVSDHFSCIAINLDSIFKDIIRRKG